VADDDRFLALAGVADEAAAGAEYSHQIVGVIIGDNQDDVDRQHLADAFRFHVDKQDGGMRFAPMATFTDGTSVPVPLAEIPEDTCETWAGVVYHATHPRARARLHDLLFERRWGDVGAHAAGAINAYIEEVAPIDPPSQRTVDGLARALELATLTKRSDMADRVIAELLRTSEASLDDPDPKPGVALRLLRVLVDARLSDPAVDQLLVRARETYHDAWNVENTIKLQLRRAPDAEARSALQRARVERWLEEAENVDPLVAVMHREKAARLARAAGLTDLADRAVHAMQSADPPELARITVPSTITDQQIEDFIESLIADTWWDSVIRVLSSGPPTGDVDRNRETAVELAREHPLQSLLPTVRLGGDGLPRYTPTSKEEEADDQLTQVETMALQVHGALAAEALWRAGERHAPGSDEVAASLTRAGCEPANAAAISRVLRRFSERDFEAATYTGLPLVERLCRELLLQVDAPIYRIQRERKPGTYPGLGALLPLLLDRGLDESWYRFLRTFLAAPNGWNFRNEALHGFINDVDALGAGLVLIALLYLALIRPQAGGEDAAPSAPQDAD
jgi:hypothetical protein